MRAKSNTYHRPSRALPGLVPQHPKAPSDLLELLRRAERIRTQQQHDKNKPYALHAPEVGRIGKGKARKPYDGHTLNTIKRQSAKLARDVGATVKQVGVDLGFRGVGTDNPSKQIIHRGKIKSMTPAAKRLAAQAAGHRTRDRAPEIG